jgi:hypothetical protein
LIELVITGPVFAVADEDEGAAARTVARGLRVLEQVFRRGVDGVNDRRLPALDVHLFERPLHRRGVRRHPLKDADVAAVNEPHEERLVVRLVAGGDELRRRDDEVYPPANRPGVVHDEPVARGRGLLLEGADGLLHAVLEDPHVLAPHVVRHAVLVVNHGEAEPHERRRGRRRGGRRRGRRSGRGRLGGLGGN